MVSGNGARGILLISGSTGNTVAGNFVGLNAAGSAAIGNFLNGIIVSDSGSTGNTIGPGQRRLGQRDQRRAPAQRRLRQRREGQPDRRQRRASPAAIPNLADGVQINDGAARQHDRRAGPGPQRHLGQREQRRSLRRRGDDRQRRCRATSSARTRRRRRPFPTAATAWRCRRMRAGTRSAAPCAGTKNVIAFNVAPRRLRSSRATGNASSATRSRSTAGLGIDLGPAGVTPNDLGDPDLGANLLQNFPILSSIVLDPTRARRSRARSTASRRSSYRIEFFSTISVRRLRQRPRPALPGRRRPDDGSRRQRRLRRDVLDGGRTGPVHHRDGDGPVREHVGVLGVPRGSAARRSRRSRRPPGPADVPSTPVSIVGAELPERRRRSGSAASRRRASRSSAAPRSTRRRRFSRPARLYDVTVTNPSTLAATLSAGFLADFTDVPQAQHLPRRRRDGLSRRDHGGMRRRQRSASRDPVTRGSRWRSSC